MIAQDTLEYPPSPITDHPLLTYAASADSVALISSWQSCCRPQQPRIPQHCEDLHSSGTETAQKCRRQSQDCFRDTCPMSPDCSNFLVAAAGIVAEFACDAVLP